VAKAHRHKAKDNMTYLFTVVGLQFTVHSNYNSRLKPAVIIQLLKHFGY